MLSMVRQALGDRYTVEREIGRGGAARVFLAQDREGRKVALKILHPELALSVTAQRFLREIGMLSKLQHPHIAQMLDSGELDFLVYYAMRYIEGQNLRIHLDRARRLSLADTVRLACDLLDALATAHREGIVHRDVKPENVVLAREGAVLLDFGIARAIAASGTERLTRSGFTVGTSAYMSPEQVNGSLEIDHRSDLYSLGCVLFECLAGKPPFHDPLEEAVLKMHTVRPAPDVRRTREDTPRPLADAIGRALEKEPRDRWQSAGEMLDALAAVRA
ncbi:MAG: serine/threonine protein kinase [Gemmatimonadetes bacterium]|nr:serine/threonine protein kinase [Gemmatimonadota bacterium]MBI2403259.1 serine/threonine protein kinase [Gemmatimonadota bacterium]MBI2535393.1 serine/threonine protein kinase [Gemmatimonadota bacterium]